MAFWRKKINGTPTPVGIASPWTPSDTLAVFTAELLGSEDAAITRAVALRVPGVKRAHGIHCVLVGGLSWYEYDDDTRTTDQPEWLTNSASGVSPYHRWFGITSDLFMTGWACLAFTEDMTDALHVPQGLWSINANTGAIELDKSIPIGYHARPVAIPLGYGENGLLVDGVDSVRASRNIERAWNERVENPAPATDLHITDPAYNEMTKREKRKIVDEWNANRRRAGGQTAVTQSFLEVKALGQTDAGLFEKGRNAIRLDLANHTAVPASIIEGAKDGSGSDVNYSNDADSRNELYDFGTARFVLAIEARLSLDDVCPEGFSIRADLSGLMSTPTPNMNQTSED